jgi:hypothetical protein
MRMKVTPCDYKISTLQINGSWIFENAGMALLIDVHKHEAREGVPMTGPVAA